MAEGALKVTALSGDERLDTRAVRCSISKDGVDGLSLLEVIRGHPKRGLELAVGETAKDLSEEVFSLRHLAFLCPIFRLPY